jgi:hypothetical protein
MYTKLTLNLNKNIIEGAKNYAKSNNVSLSRLIGNYLNSLTKKDKKEIEISPLVKSLTGVIPNEDEADYKKSYHDYLTKKYS